MMRRISGFLVCALMIGFCCRRLLARLFQSLPARHSISLVVILDTAGDKFKRHFSFKCMLNVLPGQPSFRDTFDSKSGNRASL